MLATLLASESAGHWEIDRFKVNYFLNFENGGGIRGGGDEVKGAIDDLGDTKNISKNY